MSQNKKFFVMIITLSLFIFFGHVRVFAQSIGIMSQQAEESQQKILSRMNGRFVFGQISDSSKDQFMLDTFSGRLWRIAETGEAGMFLRAIPYRNEKGEYSPVPEKITD